MFIVINTGRVKSPADAKTLCSPIAHAYRQKVKPGFIHDECAIKVDDPCMVIGVDYWGSMAACAAFYGLEETQRIIAESESYLVSPAERAVYEVCP